MFISVSTVGTLWQGSSVMHFICHLCAEIARMCKDSANFNINYTKISTVYKKSIFLPVSEKLKFIASLVSVTYNDTVSATMNQS